MYFKKDVLLNNFVNGNDLYEDNMKLWEYKNNPLKIPFFGIQFIQALIKSTIFVRNNSKEFFKKIKYSHFIFANNK